MKHYINYKKILSVLICTLAFNVNVSANKLESNNQDSIDFYKGSGFRIVNSYLRKKSKSWSKVCKELREISQTIESLIDNSFKDENLVGRKIRNISSFINENKIKQPMKVYRGISYSSLARLVGLSEDLIKNNPFYLMGRIVKEEAFMSTSSLKEVAEGFSNGRVMLRITTSSDAKAAYINEAEKEYLFDYGQKLLILGVCKKNKGAGEKPTLILDCKAL